MIPILLTLFSFLNQPTNNSNTILLQPPPGAQAVVVNTDHTFYSDRLWETSTSNPSYAAFFNTTMTVRAGWRVQNAFGLTFDSERTTFQTAVSGIVMPFDGIIDGAGTSGDQDNDIYVSQSSVTIPLNMLPGNLLTIKSDARTNAVTNIIVPGLPFGTTVTAGVILVFRTTTDARLDISYQ